MSAVTCPSCGSERTWRDGTRLTRNGDVQRYLCRNCCVRFSATRLTRSNQSERDQKFHRQSLNSLSSLTLFRQGNREAESRVPSAGKAVQTLVKVETQENRAAGATTTKHDEATIKGLIAQYAYHLEKEGYYENSAYLSLIRLLAKRGADLLDPEHVKTVIAKQNWKKSTKALAVCAYDVFTKTQKLIWCPPKYTPEETLPFIPEESELDQLIAACRSRRMAAYLQTLKETFADPGEALKLRWIDVDYKNNVITINRPVKGHKPRQINVSNKLLAMLAALPKTSQQIFPTSYSNISLLYRRMRQRAAKTLQNPRLLNIAFKTFRHWGGTMVAHYTHGNVLMVQKLLGHKNIQNTMKYIQMVHFKDDEFDVEAATSVEEAKTLLKAGFNYVVEKNGFMLFRRPKRFSA